jgi:hypothetical protein
MYRSKVKTPVILPPVAEQLKDVLVTAEKQANLIRIMAEYIKGEALRTDTYTALEKLKKSIT